MRSLLATFRQFFKDMKNQKLRTLMTMFGILWGTTSVVLLMGFGTGLYNNQMERFQGLGTNIAIIWSGMTSKPWQGLPRGRNIRFTEEDVASMKANLRSPERISPEFARYGVTIKSQKNNMLARVAGVWPEFADMRNLIPMEGGRFLNAYDIMDKRRTIFIGDEVATNLFGNTRVVGQQITVNNVPFTIVGVLKRKAQNSSYSGRDYRQCWIPSSTFRTMWSHRYPDNFVVQADRPDQMETVKKEIYGMMARKYKFDPDDAEALAIWDTTEGLKFFANFFAAFRAFLVAIGCMTLITGGIGVTNIMNVVLEERTKEIGIKMALGAKKRTIMLQFLSETIVLTAIGGSLGFGVAALLIAVYPESLTEYMGRPTINVYGAAFAIGVLGVIALVSGMFPARRAANLEPVKALKLF